MARFWPKAARHYKSLALASRLETIDLPGGPAIFGRMDFDISHLLDQWEYQPGQVVVRRFKAKDGREKIQLRVDLGLLQMNAEGRPDGKRPFGHPSLLEYHRARLHKHVAAHDGSDEGFKLERKTAPGSNSKPCNTITGTSACCNWKITPA